MPVAPVEFEQLPPDWQLYIRGLEVALGRFEDDLRDRTRGARAQSEEHPDAADWTFILADLEAFKQATQTPSIDDIRAGARP